MVISSILNIFLHLDKNLALFVQTYGSIVYALLFLIIFLETGLVATPFLPGDSLIFAAGALASIGSLNIVLLLIIITAAAIIGDTVNYSIGYFIGPKVFKEKRRFFRKDYLDRAESFYERYGAKTIIFARFIPIIRTFAPFVAGIGKMKYSKFLFYNILGAVFWVLLFLFGGYLFGNIPFVKNNFSIVLLFVIILSLLPLAHEILKRKQETLKVKTTEEARFS